MLKQHQKRFITCSVPCVDGLLEMLVCRISLWVCSSLGKGFSYLKLYKTIYSYFNPLCLATGGWPEQENPHIGRINALIEYNKILAYIEKHQLEKKKFLPKRPFMQMVWFKNRLSVRTISFNYIFNLYFLILGSV